MKKGLKILLGILIPIIIILVVYIVLIIKQIVPNPFLDTSDLVCEVIVRSQDSQEKFVFIAKFNKFAEITEYTEVYNISFNDSSELLEYEQYLKSIDKKYKKNQNEEGISVDSKFKVDEQNTYYKKTKEEIKNIFINEFYYDRCD